MLIQSVKKRDFMCFFGEGEFNGSKLVTLISAALTDVPTFVYVQVQS
jgi:hypothetical protein